MKGTRKSGHYGVGRRKGKDSMVPPLPPEAKHNQASVEWGLKDRGLCRAQGSLGLRRVEVGNSH